MTKEQKIKEVEKAIELGMVQDFTPVIINGEDTEASQAIIRIQVEASDGSPVAHLEYFEGSPTNKVEEASKHLKDHARDSFLQRLEIFGVEEFKAIKPIDQSPLKAPTLPI
jgi:hypothetical protein